jgi:site-specific recombinase XerD
VNYLDFIVEISAGRGRDYPVFVIGSPAGEAHDWMRFPFDDRGLENQLLALQTALLRSGSKLRKILSPEEQTVQNFGQALFDALFIGEVRSCYDVSQREAFHQNKGLRIKLCIQSPELASLPWEFLYDKKKAEYICFSSNTPIVRYLELPQPPPPIGVTLPLSILGVIASPKDLPELDTEHEKYRVEKSLERLRNDGLVKLTWLAGRTWQDLQRAMRNDTWHILHFIGHGGFDPQADEGMIALEDEEGYTYNMSATGLGRLVADHRPLRLIVLNSCDGAKGSKHDIFSSTAAILVRRGLPAVLAMQYEITDSAAIELSRSFYEALADGLPVDMAVTDARKAINLAISHTLEWGTPVLYMRSPNGVLFDLQVKRDKTSTTSAIIEPTRVAPPIEEQISQWLLARASKSLDTERAYIGFITNFREFLHVHELELNSEDVPTLLSLVQTWADTGIRQSIISPSTYNQRISSIRSFYKFALMKGWISLNPLEMVKMREDHIVRKVKPIEIEIEIEKVKNALKSIPRFTPSGRRDYAILCVLLTTGAGCGEIARMRYGDIERTVSSVTITTRQKHGKKGIYTLGKGTAQALIGYLAAIYNKEYPPDAPIWLSFAHYHTGLAIGKQSISDICKKWLDTTQVESTNRIYEAIKNEYGVKGIENIEKLLGINVEEEVSN